MTARGGRTSHAAVVAVGMGKPCVVGAGDIVVDEDAAGLRGGRPHGPRGRRDLDRRRRPARSSSTPSRPSSAEADRRRRASSWPGPTATGRSGVRANADTPEDARRAREFGAEGIGLVRTEHMFFARRSHPDRARDDHGRRHRPRAGGGRQAPALPARGLRRDLPRHGRAARDHPAARSAAARVPGQPEGIPGDARGARAPGRARHQPRARRPRSTSGWPRSTRSARPTRCWATAAAGSGSPRRRSTACRCGPSWRPRARSAEQGVKVEPEIMIPLTGTVGRDALTYEQTQEGRRRRARARWACPSSTRWAP